jgi:hypothetical protein
VSTSLDRRHAAFGVAVSALGAATGAVRLAAAPVRVAARAPLIGAPLRRAAAMLEAEGRAQLEGAIDDVLAGPLAEQIAYSLARNRVIERMAAEIAATADVELVVSSALESRLVLELTDSILRSAEMQRAIEHLASSPELRSAIASQSSGMAEDMVAGLRERSESIDDAAERTVRRWLRRR